MSINYPHPIQPKKPTVDVGLVLTVCSQVGAAILGIILIALFVGLGLDALLNTTKHPFTVVFFLGSVPFSLIVTYWLARRTTKNLNFSGPAEKQARRVENEDDNE